MTAKPRKPWPDRIKNFTPAWFSVTMGTGALPILLSLLAYPTFTASLRPISLALYTLNILLLLFFISLTILRYLRHPRIFILMLHHPFQSLFLGTFPMGLTTVVSGGMLLFPDSPRVHLTCYILWWIQLLPALGTAIALVFYIIKAHTYTYQSANASLLLPIVTLVVASSAGTALVPSFPGAPGTAVLATSFLILSVGMFQSALIIGWYFWRLISIGLPSRESITTSFLPIGPLCQGAFAIIRMGELRGGVAQELAVLVGWFLLANGSFWVVMAVAAVGVRRPERFNLGWWGATFPLATWALAAGALGRAGEGEGFNVVAAGMTVVVLGVWGVCMVGTAWKGFWMGEMFHAPCIVGWVADGEGEVEEGRGK